LNVIINKIGEIKLIEYKFEGVIIFGMIEVTIKNSTINPPTIIKNNENPIHEFFDMLEIIILIIIVIQISEKINFLEDFSELIKIFNKIIIIITWDIYI